MQTTKKERQDRRGHKFTWKYTEEKNQEKSKSYT